MKKLSGNLTRLFAKKVPAVSLVLVAAVAAVLGVFAANIVVTTKTYQGEIGTLHTNNGNVTVTDNGLGVVANGASAVTTANFNTASTVNNAMTAGHWFDKLTLTDSFSNDAASHTVTVTINSGTGIAGATNLVNAQTFTITSTSPNGATITAYLDLGVTTITSPLTTYVNVT
jgi:hypothetical protein